MHLSNAGSAGSDRSGTELELKGRREPGSRKGTLDGYLATPKNPPAAPWRAGLREDRSRREQGPSAGLSMWLVVLFLSIRFPCEALPTNTMVLFLATSTALLYGDTELVCHRERLHGASHMAHLAWRTPHGAQGLFSSNQLSCGGTRTEAPPNSAQAAKPCGRLRATVTSVALISQAPVPAQSTRGHGL